jgi:tryptophan-rich sensory protein
MTGLPDVAFGRYAALLAGCLLLAFLPGITGAQFPPDVWYAGLVKPALTPPGWVFPVVWSLLYITIGLSLFVFLLHVPADARRLPLAVFGVQLVLNGAWSWLFFGHHAIGLALVEMIGLWIAIVATMVVFARHSRFAAKLLVPYLAWVTFATYLTYAIWRAN